MEHKFILECCADSVKSAIYASNAGADRLELCANLSVGGTTPSLALFHQVQKYCRKNLPIHVLIRPRAGDFYYDYYETEIMEEEIRMFREEGAQGVVIGALETDGSLDLPVMHRLVEAAGDMKITLHRAFDQCRDPIAALNEAIEMEMNTILTSGQQKNCWEGRSLIADLVREAKGRIDIMPGSGMEPELIPQMYEETAATTYHMSCKTKVQSPMRYRLQEVSFDLEPQGEYEFWVTSEAKVRKAAEILKSMYLSHSQMGDCNVFAKV